MPSGRPGAREALCAGPGMQIVVGWAVVGRLREHGQDQLRHRMAVGFVFFFFFFLRQRPPVARGGGDLGSRAAAARRRFQRLKAPHRSQARADAATASGSPDSTPRDRSRAQVARAASLRSRRPRDPSRCGGPRRRARSRRSEPQRTSSWEEVRRPRSAFSVIMRCLALITISIRAATAVQSAQRGSRHAPTPFPRCSRSFWH